MTSLSRSALLLSVVFAAPLQAASQGSALPADAPPVEELTELEEVRVRGKLVANAVITVENRVFRLYNKLNKNNRFDVHCMDMRLNPDSLALQRTCLPEFVGYYPAATQVGIGGYYIPPPPFSHDTSMSSYGGSTFSYYSPPMSTFTAFPPAPPIPAASVISSAQRTEYADNVLRVIRSDPQLLEMATELVGMYQEMDRVQAHFVKLRLERQADQAARKAAARQRAREEGRSLRPTHPRAL